MNSAAILDKLSSFIDAESPALATFLQRQWKQEQNAITYGALRNAILDGQLDMSYLTQWQQDYSKFVVDHYAPVAEKAVKEAAKDLLGKYGGSILDPQSSLIEQFIATHGGKLIREVSQMQYMAINTLVRQASLADTMTVDQLARAIRPCIGLTQRQAQATKNYYDKLIEQGYNAKDAQKKQAVYAERMHRHRAATIAQTEMAYAYNAAADAVIRENIKVGRFEPGVTKRWLTAADERVCDECGALDMQTAGLDAPFPNGVLLPPAHPNCRCAVAYDNVIVAVQPAAQQQPEAKQQTDPTFEKPNIPNAPEFDGMQYIGSENLGTGEMHQYIDAEGQEWIFKPAQGKYTGTAEPFRGYVQEAGYKVQAIVDPDSAVPCGTITLDTPKGQKFGAAQLRIVDADTSFNLKDWQSGGQAPSPDIIAQLQRENVTDWLMCNYDSHGGNFVLSDSTGMLFGLDKEQAFRYIDNAGAQKMSLTFHPNSKYGETEPIYNTLYRKYAKGEIDLDLNNVLPYIKRVETIPDAEYREIFRRYAESLHGKGNKAEQLLDKIVDRKTNMRNTFTEFYSDLLTQRKGKATLFEFADEAAQAAKPLQAAAMSSKTLAGMSLPDLKTIAQQKGIKYAWNMNKAQLVEAISDPGKTAQIVQDAKNRAYGIGTTPRKPKATATAAATATGKKPKISGITQLSEAMEDFDAALDSADLRGVSLISDKTALEGLQLNLRKLDIDGNSCYELSGKLTHSRWLTADQDVALAHGDHGQWTFDSATGKLDYSKPVLSLTSSNAAQYRIPTRYLRDGDNYLILTEADCEKQARAMMGEFSVRIYASDGKEAARKARSLISKAKLDDIFEDVEPVSIDRYKKMRIIWQHDPAMAAKLDLAKSSDNDIQKALNKLGVTQARVDRMRLVKVTDGYFTFVDDAVSELAKEKGVAYVWSGVGSKASAISIIQSGEMLSSTQRLKRGILSGGESVGEDIKTGGADNVFTRIAMRKNVGIEAFSDSFAHGSYQFVFDRKVLSRTDWYAYTNDEYGSTRAGTFEARRDVSKHFDALNRSYHCSNEVMFRKSLSLRELKEIRCDSGWEKTELIDELHQKGITEINGVKLEKFIKVGGGTL